MNIIIFEDNNEDCVDLIGNLKDFFDIYNFNCIIKKTRDPEVIYSNIDKVDLIFLDIEVNEYNGIDVGLKIRKLNKDVRIIITSGYSKYLIDGYKVHADRYFLKPLQKDQFQIEMKIVVSDYIRYNQNFYDPKVAKNIIYYRDILYIEFINRKSYLYKIDGQVLTSAYSLTSWIDKLAKQSFVQTHRGFIVNMDTISAYETKKIILINGAIVPLSRNYRDNFEKTYLSFLRSKV